MTSCSDGLLRRTTSHDSPALPVTNSSWDVQVRPAYLDETVAHEAEGTGDENLAAHARPEGPWVAEGRCSLRRTGVGIADVSRRLNGAASARCTTSAGWSPLPGR